MTRARDLADVVSGNFAIPSGSLSNVQIPTLSSLGIDTRVLPTGWSAALSGTDMVLSYSNTSKVKLTTAGALIVVDDITGFGSV